MPCSLTDDGSSCSATTGSVITLRVIATATRLVKANYNDVDVPLAGNSVTFTVVAGPAPLLLDLAGPEDAVEIVQDCGDGKTKHLFGYHDDYHPIIGFKIVGAP